MLNKDQLRKQVIQYFRNIGSGENITQCIKEVLFLYKNFNPVNLFEKLSKGKQKLTVGDIRNFLVSKNVAFQEKQLKYFLKHYGFKKQITLNEFLEALIPYNADVVRIFKSEFLQRLQLREIDEEVQYIFIELIQNELKLHRSILNIREDISRIATRKNIEDLIKEDLVMKFKPRQARKHEEAFNSRNFQLSYNQLRKFLEVSLQQKDIIHEFQLLNIMRHLRSENPFDSIVFSDARGRSHKKRAVSANPNNKLRGQQLFDQSNNSKNRTKEYDFSNNGQDKYGQFKHQILKDYVQKRSPAKPAHTPKPNESHKEFNQRGSPKNQIDESLRRSKYIRQSQGINGTYIVQILQEMVKKEQRLQKLRRNLAKTNDFNLINLFKLLDTRNKGYVSARDINQFSNSGRVQFENMVRFYAYEPDQLRFHEFCLVFRPLSRQLNQGLDQRQQNKVPNPFCKQTTKLILQILAITAQMHNTIGLLKRKVQAACVDPRDLFRFVDVSGKGYLTARCFQEVLAENNIFSDDTDIKCLMKLFRKKIDERISLPEFVNFIKI